MDTAELLRATYLFRDVDAQALAPLVRATRFRVYPPGSMVFQAGDPAADLCIVATGRIAYSFSSEDGDEYCLEVMWPGSIFGEPALFAPERRRVLDAVAIEESRVALVPREPLVVFLLAHPEVMLRLVEGLASHTRTAAAGSAELVFSQVRQRIIRRVVELLDRQGRGDAAHVDLSQSRLAALVGASRENVNRVLSALAREGLVRVDGRRLAVVDPRRLREMAGETWPELADRNAVRS